MNLTTAVFLVILAFFTWRGYQKGFIGAITKLMSFVIAYPAAIFFTKPFANFLRGVTGLDGLVLFMVAGCTIFFAVSLLVTLILNGVGKIIPSNQFTETGSKIGGTVFGLVVGSIFGLMVVYLIGITRPHTQMISAEDAAKTTHKNMTAAEAESIQKYVVPEDAPAKDPFIDTTAKKLVSTAASTAVGMITSDDASKQLTKSVTQDPHAVLNHVQNITNDNEFKQLLNNPDFQAELNKGDASALRQNQEFQALMQNPDMRAIVASDGKSDEVSEQAAAEKMIQAWQKVETLKNDPRVLQILSDPAFQAQLNSPNKLPLLMNPRMRELSEIIFSSDSTPVNIDSLKAQRTSPSTITRYQVEDITNDANQNSRDIDTAIDAEADAVPEQKLYRWTDADGKAHYSDKPIKH